MERHKYTPAFHLHRFPPGHHHFPAFLINVFILQIFTPFPPFWLSQPLLALCSVKSTVLLWLTGKNTQANFKQLTLYLCQRFTPEGQIVPHSFPENKKYTLKLVKILFQCVILSFSKSPESYLFLEVTRLASMGERERDGQERNWHPTNVPGCIQTENSTWCMSSTTFLLQAVITDTLGRGEKKNEDWKNWKAGWVESESETRDRALKK